jgi:nucleotide-binding universal stress UspA family protein
MRSMVLSATGHTDRDCACSRLYGEGVDSSEIFIIVALAWSLLGVSMALVMGRRGHQPFMWLVLGITFGPLVLPLAANALGHDRPGLLKRLSPGRPGTGGVDVLVGIDGSAEAEDALRMAIGLLGPRLGRLTLAAVVDYDIADGSSLAEDNERARGDLIRTANATALRPETVLLSGRPAEALRKFAVEEGYGLIVVGRRGRGASHVLLGSVASKLAHGGDVPVLIV